MGYRLQGSVGRTLHQVEERRGSSGLNYGEARHLVDEAELVQFAQGLAEGGGITQIAAGEDDPVGWIPVALIQHFDDDRLLAFDAEGVDGVQQVNAETFGEAAHQGEDLIEVRLHLEGARAVFESLGQLAVGDVAVRDEDDRLQARGACVGGHGGGSVARGHARDSLHPEPHGLRCPARHAVVLERACRVESLVLEDEAVESAVLRSPRTG